MKTYQQENLQTSRYTTMSEIEAMRLDVAAEHYVEAMAMRQEFSEQLDQDS